MVCGLMSRVRHTVRSVERDVGFFSRDLREKFRDMAQWGPSGASVATYTSTILSAQREIAIFPLYIPTVFWLSSVLGPQILSKLPTLFFFSSVSSLSSFASSCLTGRVLERDKTDSLEEGLNYCHRCPTKLALSCFSPLWVTLNVSDCHSL